jgi:hypothetical protein
MHLLAAKSGTIDDGLEPFDLSQTPADSIIYFVCRLGANSDK